VALWVEHKLQTCANSIGARIVGFGVGSWAQVTNLR